jgi:hypothetical protein
MFYTSGQEVSDQTSGKPKRYSAGLYSSAPKHIIKKRGGFYLKTLGLRKWSFKVVSINRTCSHMLYPGPKFLHNDIRRFDLFVNKYFAEI